MSETLETLNLSAAPFAATTPMENLFPGAMRRAVLDQLLQLSRETNDIVALLGPSGSGKSIIGDFFARQAGREQIVARARASLLTSPSQLLEEMFKAFVLDFPPQASLADLKSALLDYFAAVYRQDRNVVLIVDDAHELGDEAFSLLTRLALVDNGQGTFRLVLLGEQSLFDMLDYTCPLKNGAQQFQSVQLPAFSLKETRDYLRYRLNCVRFNREDQSRAMPFSARQIEKIHRQSGGQPGAINALADQILTAPRGRAVMFDLVERIPRKYAMAIVALLSVLLIAFLSGGEEETPQSAQRTINVPIALPGQDADEVPAAVPDTVSNAEAPGTAITAATPAISDASPAAAVTVAPSPVVAEPVTAPAAAPSTPASVTTSVTTPAPTPALPVQTSTPTVSSSSSAVTAPRDQIMALPATQFTLQVLGSSSRTNVEAFVARHPASSLLWFETRNNGSPWFVIIQGAYASRDAAQSAIASLPAELRSQQPWVRSVGDVQNDIRARN